MFLKAWFIYTLINKTAGRSNAMYPCLFQHWITTECLQGCTVPTQIPECCTSAQEVEMMTCGHLCTSTIMENLFQIEAKVDMINDCVTHT